MFSNPKTTALGIITLVISVLTIAQHVLTGGFAAIGAQDLPALMSALAGMGLIAAQDGSK